MPYEPTINPYWNIIITVTTVGYGDIVPRTNLGRLAACCGMFFGQFVISLILLAMTISAQFTQEESKGFRDMKVIEYFVGRARLAARILSVQTLMKLCDKQIKNQAEASEEDQINEVDQIVAKNAVIDGIGKEESSAALEANSVTNIVQPTIKKKFKLDRYAKIGALRAIRMLKIKYIQLVRQFKEDNAYICSLIQDLSQLMRLKKILLLLSPLLKAN